MHKHPSTSRSIFPAEHSEALSTPVNLRRIQLKKSPKATKTWASLYWIHSHWGNGWLFLQLHAVYWENPPKTSALLIYSVLMSRKCPLSYQITVALPSNYQPLTLSLSPPAPNPFTLVKWCLSQNKRKLARINHFTLSRVCHMAKYILVGFRHCTCIWSKTGTHRHFTLRLNKESESKGRGLILKLNLISDGRGGTAAWNRLLTKWLTNIPVWHYSWSFVWSRKRVLALCSPKETVQMKWKSIFNGHTVFISM